MSSRRKRIIKFSGKTEDGRLVVSGLFKLLDTHGLPLEVSAMILEDKGYIPDWLSFYLSALNAGWPKKRALLKIEAAALDAYGADYKDSLMNRFQEFFDLQSSKDIKKSKKKKRRLRKNKN